MDRTNQFWVYILYCENETYYTGYTTDLKKRYQSHVDGTGRCKYTRSFKPLRIAQAWEVQGSKADAMRLERWIKSLSRAEKEKLIQYPSLFSSTCEADNKGSSKVKKRVAALSITNH